jgi:hypothetical protein
MLRDRILGQRGKTDMCRMDLAITHVGSAQRRSHIGIISMSNSALLNLTLILPFSDGRRRDSSEAA